MANHIKLIILLLLVSSLQLTAQHNCKIIYKERIVASQDALKQHGEHVIRKKHADEGNNTDSISDAEKTTIDLMAESALQFISAKDSLSLKEVFREGDFLVTREIESIIGGLKRTKKYNLTNLALTVIDSLHSAIADTVITKILPAGELQQGEFSVQLTKESKLLNGYKCLKILISIKSSPANEQEGSFWEVWATRDIKPVLPVYAVLNLGKKILEDYTPLLIKESYGKEAAMYGETSAASIKWY